MRNELKDKDYRDAYAKAFMRNAIAFQILAMRKKARLSQKELGDLCGMKQNAISRLEDPEYGKLSLETLGKLAAAFDVVPWAGFISFSDMEMRRWNLSEESLSPSNFTEDEESEAKFRILIAGIVGSSKGDEEDTTDGEDALGKPFIPKNEVLHGQTA